MIVVVGEALIDFSPEVRGGDRYMALPGGGPANAAVAFARLGGNAKFLSRVSLDGRGEQLIEWLGSNGVDTSLVVRASEPTTLAIADVDEDGIADYTFYATATASWNWAEDELPLSPPPGAHAVHFGSLATVMQPGADAIQALVDRWAGELTTFVDPNFRSGLDSPEAARTRAERWISTCDIVKLSTDDIDYAFPGADPRSLCVDWAAQNAVMILLTDGGDGAHAYVSDEHYFVAAPAITVADTIGAGDSFGAAFLFALDAHDALAPGRERSGATISAALEFACHAAATTCSRVGADSPYISEFTDEIRRLVAEPVGIAADARTQPGHSHDNGDSVPTSTAS